VAVGLSEKINTFCLRAGKGEMPADRKHIRLGPQNYLWTALFHFDEIR
jgi:hypothetical protein